MSKKIYLLYPLLRETVFGVLSGKSEVKTLLEDMLTKVGFHLGYTECENWNHEKM